MCMLCVYCEIHFARVLIYCSFQVVKGPTRGLRDDSDVAESDACSKAVKKMMEEKRG